jgi:hypothetical protein
MVLISLLSFTSSTKLMATDSHLSYSSLVRNQTTPSTPRPRLPYAKAAASSRQPRCDELLTGRGWLKQPQRSSSSSNHNGWLSKPKRTQRRSSFEWPLDCTSQPISVVPVDDTAWPELSNSVSVTACVTWPRPQQQQQSQPHHDYRSFSSPNSPSQSSSGPHTPTTADDYFDMATLSSPSTSTPISDDNMASMDHLSDRLFYLMKHPDKAVLLQQKHSEFIMMDGDDCGDIVITSTNACQIGQHAWVLEECLPRRFSG